MDDLLREFLTETAESMTKLNVEIVQLEQNPNNPELLGSIFRLVHTVKGTCGFIGLPRLEKLAHVAENVFGKFRDGELPVTFDPRWQDVSADVYRLKKSLLVILDVARLLRVPQERAA